MCLPWALIAKVTVTNVPCSADIIASTWLIPIWAWNLTRFLYSGHHYLIHIPDTLRLKCIPVHYFSKIIKTLHYAGWSSRLATGLLLEVSSKKDSGGWSFKKPVNNSLPTIWVSCFSIFYQLICQFTKRRR